MAFKRPKRGISVGTIAILALCVVTLAVGGFIFLRISGDMSEITLDPKLLTEPLNALTQTIGGEPSQVASSSGTGTESSAVTTSGDAEPPMELIVTPAPTQSPTVPPSRSLSLTAVGQVSVGSELRADGSQGFDSVFAPLDNALAGADLSILTLRSQLTEDASSYDNYNAPASLASSLREAGVNLINLSTDRLLDHGTGGVTATRAILRNLGISAAGGYSSESERQALTMVNVNGIQVGVLSYTNTISSAGKKAASDAEINTATRMLTLDAATADISTMRAQGADLIIVLAHWGNRSDTKPSKETRDMAQALASAGADIILGTNPTSVHEIERISVTGTDGQPREAFVAYSLGNFLVDESRDTADITGMVLHLAIDWDAQAQRATITDSWYLPTWIMRWRDAGGTNRYNIVPAGTSAVPENMTASIFGNMNKAYQSMVNKLGTGVATPRTEP